jgi:XTP/dITP diphosphohydrolase
MLLLATRSAGKLRELRPLFAARGIGVVDLVEAGIPASPAEDGLEVHATFEANALAKAEYFFARTGRPTVADDSGLCVEALGGRPGVQSKRWSGRVDLAGLALDDENNRLLLALLDGVADRRAHYVCAAAYVDGVRALTCRGEVRGTILREARGGGGFGYDPYFAADELDGRTFGETPTDEKELVSHRGRAFRALLAQVSGVSELSELSGLSQPSERSPGDGMSGRCDG